MLENTVSINKRNALADPIHRIDRDSKQPIWGKKRLPKAMSFQPQAVNLVIAAGPPCHQHLLARWEWITRLPWMRSDSILTCRLPGRIVSERCWNFWSMAKKSPPQCWQTTSVASSFFSIRSVRPQTGQCWWKKVLFMRPLSAIQGLDANRNLLTVKSGGLLPVGCTFPYRFSTNS